MEKAYVFLKRDVDELKRMFRKFKAGIPPLSEKGKEPRRKKGGGGGGAVYGALAIVKGTVPESSGIDTSGNLIVNPTTGKSVFTPGKLEVDPPSPATTFDSGALMVYPTGEAIVVNGSLQIFNVMNPSRSKYSGNGESIVEGSLVTDAEGVEWFCISWDDDSRSEGHLKGTAPAVGAIDDPDLQIKYHSGGEDNYKVASLPCEEPAP